VLSGIIDRLAINVSAATFRAKNKVFVESFKSKALANTISVGAVKQQDPPRRIIEAEDNE
jgi:hypothetical protein